MGSAIDSSPGAWFGARADVYDERAVAGIPGYVAMLDALEGVLPERARRVLELGCGTGALTLRLARVHPQAEITAVDASPEMLDVAAERLRVAGAPEVRLEAATFESLELEPGRYDLVTSSMALHHLARKGPFYWNVRRALADGGAFVFADELSAVAPYVEERHWNAWLDFARRPGHLEADEIEAMLAHIAAHDHYETLPDQLELLRLAGFGRVDCVWRQLNYAVFTALP